MATQEPLTSEIQRGTKQSKSTQSYSSFPWMGQSQTGSFFYDVTDRAIIDPDFPCLINAGSCGLHVVYGAFKYGIASTGWKMDSLLKSLWYMFSGSPARRVENMKTLQDVASGQ